MTLYTDIVDLISERDALDESKLDLYRQQEAIEDRLHQLYDKRSEVDARINCLWESDKPVLVEMYGETLLLEQTKNTVTMRPIEFVVTG